jgi:predicted TIM-barrel fold metal-dependent hydrolase
VWVTPFWEDDCSELLANGARSDRLVLGSDWPHAEGVRQPADFVTESLAGLPDNIVQRISRDNALELFHLAYD